MLFCKVSIFNPWDNPYQIAAEKLLKNPKTGEYETIEHREERLEMEHFDRIVRAFNYYATWMFKRLQKKHYDWFVSLNSIFFFFFWKILKYLFFSKKNKFQKGY